MRRLLLMGLGCVILGGLLNLGVAEVASRRLPMVGAGHGAARGSADATDRALWRSLVPANWPDPAQRLTSRRMTGVHVVQLMTVLNDFDVLSMDDAVAQRQFEARESFWLLSRDYGWPMQAVAIEEWRHIQGFQRNATQTNAIHLAGVDWPRRPIWGGLIVNTLIYAACLFMFIHGRGWLVRSARRRGGRCPHCGYDLRGQRAAGCPECGWNRPR